MMKKFLLLILIIPLLSFGQVVVEYDKLTMKNDKYFYENELFTGLTHGYLDEEELHFEVFLKEGIYHGSSKYYLKNGQLFMVGFYKEGKYHGYGMTFYKNGHIKSEGNANNGKRDGVFKLYDKLGQLSKIQVYKNDNLISEKCFNEAEIEISCE